MAEARAGEAKPSRARRRIDWIEWLRASGCVAIVALHVFVSLHNAVGDEALGPTRLAVESATLTLLTRWAVPCFLMVSGMLLLDPARTVDARRIGAYLRRMLFVLGTFGLFFCLVESSLDYGGLSLAVVGEAVVHLLTGQSWDHLWYLYALILLYLLTPALRQLVARLSGTALGLLLAAAYVVALVLPTLRWDGSTDFTTPVNIVPALFYYVLGHYVASRLELGWPVAVAGALSGVALLVTAAQGNDLLSTPQYCLVAPWGVLVFLLFRRFATAPVDAWPAAELLANYSFGIYVVHPMFIHAIIYLTDPLTFPAGVFELGAFAATLAASLLTVWALKKLPGFARYL